MKGTGILVAAGLLAGSAFGKPVKQRSAFAVKDSHHIPRRWTQVGYPESDHKISLRIGLKQSSFPELERHLCEFTTTYSPASIERERERENILLIRCGRRGFRP